MGWLGKLFGGGRASNPQEFWSWFVKNAPRFEGPPGQVPTDELDHQLTGVHAGLAFVIGGAREGGVHELEISAQGSRKLMPVVREVIDAAPAVAGWRFFAFRQPHPGLSVQLGPARMSAESIHFVAAPAPDEAGADVAIFVDGFDSNPDMFGEITFLVLDGAVGELAVMTKIRGLDFIDGSKRPSFARPLTELPEVLAAVRERVD